MAPQPPGGARCNHSSRRVPSSRRRWHDLRLLHVLHRSRHSSLKRGSRKSRVDGTNAVHSTPKQAIAVPAALVHKDNPRGSRAVTADGLNSVHSTGKQAVAVPAASVHNDIPRGSRAATADGLNSVHSTGEQAVAVPAASVHDDIPESVKALFVTDKNQVREDLPTYVLSLPAVTEEDVPGDLRKFKKTSDPVLNSTAAAIHWLLELHSLGYTLSGKFNSASFKINHRSDLEGQKKLLRKLRKLTPKRRKKDMIACSAMVKNDFFAGCDPPEDMQHHIFLMKHFRPRYAFLIQYHASLERGVRKSSLFTCMFDRLQVIKKLDHAKYQRILNQIPYEKSWMIKAKSNTHLKGALYHVDNSRKKKNRKKKNFRKKNSRKKQLIVVGLVPAGLRYDLKKSELLRFRRNGTAHVHKDNSVVTAAEAAAIAIAAAAAAAAAATGSSSAAAGSSSAAAAPTSVSAAAAATTVSSTAQQVQQPAVQQQLVQLFDGEDVDRMYTVSHPKLLVRFQKAMHDEQEFCNLNWHQPYKGVRLFRDW